MRRQIWGNGHISCSFGLRLSHLALEWMSVQGKAWFHWVAVTGTFHVHFSLLKAQMFDPSHFNPSNGGVAIFPKVYIHLLCTNHIKYPGLSMQKSIQYKKYAMPPWWPMFSESNTFQVSSSPCTYSFVLHLTHWLLNHRIIQSVVQFQRAKRNPNYHVHPFRS